MDLFIRLFKEVLYLSVMASILVILLMALKKVFHKALSPKWHYYLWIVLILRLTLPFQPPSTLSIYSIFYAAAETANLPISAAVEPFQNPPPDALDNGANNTAYSGGPAPNETSDSLIVDKEAARHTTAPNDWIKAAAFVWLAGMFLLSLYTAYTNIAFASEVRRRYAPLDNERITRLLDSCKAALHIQRTIPLLTANKARTPALYGLRRPKILVSEACMAQLNDGEISHVFLHELSHLKRKDIAVNWLMTVLQIIYFFNPLIWYAFCKIREDCEISCDAEALTYLKSDEHQQYGGTIIKLMRLFSESSFIPVTAGISKNKSSIKRRILMIKGYKKSKWTGTLLAVIILVIVSLAGLSGCSTTANNAPANTASPSPSAEISTPDASARPSDTAAEIASLIIKVSPTPMEKPTARPSENPPVTANPTPAAAAENTYDGQWKVNKVLAYGAVGTYSKEDAEKQVGKSLSFSADAASILNDQSSDKAVVIKNPNYQEAVISKDNFLTDFRLSLDKLGIDADSVTRVEVSGSGVGGCTLLIKDSSTMILVAGGTYFELVRAK